MKILEIKNLEVVYDADEGKVEALDRVSMEIEKGEVVSLVGESGCGKSTLARSILRVIPSPGKITNGEIFLKDQDILQQPDKWMNHQIRGNEITLIPQDPLSSLNPLFRIGTQMRDIYKESLRKKSYHVDRTFEATILRMLNRVQLSKDILRRLPGEISGGQRQRIMIAMALQISPSLLIADEPTTALDVTTESQILKLLKKLVREEKSSVLYITHDLAVASKISEKIVVMYAGQEVESAPSNLFFKNPVHPYSVKLLTCLPNPGGKIQDIPGRVPNLIDPPPGCRFAARCDRRFPECERHRPPKTIVGEKHWVRCYNPYGPLHEKRGSY